MMKRIMAVLLAVLLLAGCDVPAAQEPATVSLPSLHVEPLGPNDPNASNDPNTTYTPNDPNTPNDPQDPNASNTTDAPGGSDAHPEGSYYGEPVSALPELTLDKTLFFSENSLVWREDGGSASAEDPAPSQPRICAVISEDGETVTGWIAWTQEADGTWSCESEGITPIAPVEDPGAIAKYSQEEAEALLGPRHIGRSSTSITWYTRDGKLLTLYPYGVAMLADLPTSLCRTGHGLRCQTDGGRHAGGERGALAELPGERRPGRGRRGDAANGQRHGGQRAGPVL